MIVPDAASYFAMYDEIIEKEIYKFRARNNSPVIVDWGANVGVSLYYFSKAYPNAKIYGYEADPYIFNYLSKNVGTFNNGKIEIFNCAVWDEETKLKFFSEGADAGHVADGASTDDKKIREVSAIDANNILRNYDHIDMLKIDIEGAERTVFPHISDQLYKIDYIFMEYHSRVGEEQGLTNIINALEDNNFRLYIKPGFCPMQPLSEAQDYMGIDCELEIFAVKVL